MVRQAVPGVWEGAAPEALVQGRADAATVALRRVAQSVEHAAIDVIDALETTVARPGAAGGRALFASNRDIASFDDPVTRLWQGHGRTDPAGSYR